MKLFKYIILTLIFGLAVRCGLDCLTALSMDAYLYFAMVLSCGLVVLFHDGKKMAGRKKGRHG